MRRRSREHQLVLTVAVSLTLAVLSFVVSRAISEVMSRMIERQAESISSNAVIATQALTAARTNVGRAAFAMSALRLTDIRTSSERRRDTRSTPLAASGVELGQIPLDPVLCWRARARGERETAVAKATLEAEDVSARLRNRDREAALRAIDERALPAMEQASEGFGSDSDSGSGDLTIVGVRLSPTTQEIL
jgi:hypothetical protein